MQDNFSGDSNKSVRHLNLYYQSRHWNTFLWEKKMPKNKTFRAEAKVKEDSFGKSRSRLRDLHFGHLIVDSSSISRCSSSKIPWAFSRSREKRWSRTLKFIRLLAPGYR